MHLVHQHKAQNYNKLHESNAISEIYIFNLFTGHISSSDHNTIQIVHGIIMIISWSILTTIGIFSSRFRLILYSKLFKTKSKAMCFFVHRGVQCTGVIFVVIAFGIAIYFT
eukprot:224536_1